MCACFIYGLNLCLFTGFCRIFPSHSVVQSLNTAHQRKVLQDMLQAAQQAEDDFLTITWIFCKAVGLSQAFVATLPGGGGKGTPTVDDTPVKPRPGCNATPRVAAIPLMGQPLLQPARGVVGVSSLITAAAVHTNGQNLQMENISWFAQTATMPVCTITQRRTLTGYCCSCWYGARVGGPNMSKT